MFILWKERGNLYESRFENNDLISFIEKLNEIYYHENINSNDITVMMNGDEIPKRTWLKFYIY